MPLLTIAVMLALHVPNPGVQGRADSRSWYQAYEEGKLAVGKNDSAAISSLEAAKRTGPKPARNVNTYGDTYITFNPDYYLGVAYLNQKRFADAASAFQRVRDAQLIGPKDKENATFTRQAAKASFELTIVTAEQALATGQFDQALEVASGAHGMAMGSAADLRRVSDLAERIEKAKATAPKAAGATPPPTDPKSTLRPTPQPADPYTTAPPSGNSNANPPVTPATPTGGNKAPGNTTPRRISPGVSSSVSSVSPREEAAMTLFFKGDYAGAVTELMTVINGPSPTARAYFYLACGKAGLALTGQADRRILQDAQTFFATARGDSSAFSADRKYISPRILQLLGGKQ